MHDIVRYNVFWCVCVCVCEFFAMFCKYPQKNLESWSLASTLSTHSWKYGLHNNNNNNNNNIDVFKGLHNFHFPQLNHKTLLFQSQNSNPTYLEDTKELKTLSMVVSHGSKFKHNKHMTKLFLTYMINYHSTLSNFETCLLNN